MNQTRRVAREKWRQVVGAQPVSGMTVAAYCREHQVTESAFFAWRRRLRQSAKPVGLSTDSPVGSSPAVSLPAAGFVEVMPPREPGKPRKLRRKLRQEAGEAARGSSAGEANTQAKTKVAPKEDHSSAIEICLNGGNRNGMNGERRRSVTLRVRQGFDRELLRELIGVLETMEDRS